MAGILGIFGFIVAIMIAANVELERMDLNRGFKFLAAGSCCGLSALAAGLAIGICGCGGVISYAREQKTYIGLVLSMIFSEVIGMYGFIIGVIMVAS